MEVIPNKLFYMVRPSLSRDKILGIGWATLIKGNMFGEVCDTLDLWLPISEAIKKSKYIVDICLERYYKALQYQIENDELKRIDNVDIKDFMPSPAEFFETHEPLLNYIYKIYKNQA